jgi:MFS family permease
MTDLVLSGKPVGARIATTAVFLANGSGIGAWAASLPVLKHNLDLSASGLALALFAFAVGSIVGLLSAGWLAKFGSQRTMIIGCFGAAVSLALPGRATVLPELALGALLFGVCNGLIDVAMNTYATSVQRAWRAPIMSSFHAAFSLGGLLGAAGMGTLLAHRFDAATGFLAASIFIAMLTMLAAVLATSESRLSEAEPDAAGHGFTWPSAALLGVGFLCFLAMLIEGALADWSGVYLSTVARASEGTAAAGYAGFSVMMAFGRLIGDRVVATFGGPPVLRLGAVVVALGLAVALVLPLPIIATFGFALVGIGAANIVPLLFTAAGQSRTAAPGIAIAMVATVGYAGFLLGPPIIGFAADLLGLRTALIIVFAGAATIATTAGRILPR